LLKLNKCTMVFAIGMVVATASMAFFSGWMQQGMAMPQQMMQMSPLQQNMVQSAQPCACTCKTN